MVEQGLGSGSVAVLRVTIIDSWYHTRCIKAKLPPELQEILKYKQIKT